MLSSSHQMPNSFSGSSTLSVYSSSLFLFRLLIRLLIIRPFCQPYQPAMWPLCPEDLDVRCPGQLSLCPFDNPRDDPSPLGQRYWLCASFAQASPGTQVYTIFSWIQDPVSQCWVWLQGPLPPPRSPNHLSVLSWSCFSPYQLTMMHLQQKV